MAVETEFRAGLEAAGAEPTVERRIKAVKLAVAQQVAHLNNGASVTGTGFFNHRYEPDMVINFQGGDCRTVYIRLTSDPLRLVAEYPKADDTPMVVPITDFATHHHDQPGWRDLTSLAHESGGWVADPSALDTLREGAVNQPTTQLLSSALVSGGVGVDDERSVRNLTTNVEEGFAAAGKVESHAVEATIGVLGDSLNASEFGRFARMLRAIWVGSGGDTDKFPAPDRFDRLSPDDINYLIATISTGSPEFWRTVGRGFNGSLLPALSTPSITSDAFQHVVAGALPTLTSKAVKARLDSQPSLFNTSEPFWTVEDSCLAVRGSGWSCLLAAKTLSELPATPKKVRQQTQPREYGITPEIGEARLAKAGAKLVSATYVDGVWRRTADPLLDSPSDSRTLGELNLDNDNTRITTLTVSAPEVSNLSVHYDTLVATGQTSASYPTAPLLRVAIPLLIDLSVRDTTGLRSLLAFDPPRTEDRQPTLFDD